MWPPLTPLVFDSPITHTLPHPPPPSDILLFQEMVETKGLAEDVADKIGEFVKLKGQYDLIDTLMAGPLGTNKTGKVMKL